MTKLSRRALMAAAGALVPLSLAASRRSRAASGRLPPEDPIAGKSLLFNEGFTTLDPALWHAGPKATRFDTGFYGRSAFAPIGGLEGFDPYKLIEDPAAEDGRALQISARYIGRKMNVHNYYGNDNPEFQWVSGNIQGAKPDGTILKSWRNGYFEARMWMPQHPLTWPAFWLMNNRSIIHSRRCIELDVVEHKGWELELYGAYLHEWGEPGERGEGSGVLPGVDVTRGYHLYGFLVDGDFCAPYFDRRPAISRETGTAIGWTLTRAAELDRDGDAFWPLLTLALRADIPYPTLAPGQELAHLKIDHFRVYG